MFNKINSIFQIIASLAVGYDAFIDEYKKRTQPQSKQAQKTTDVTYEEVN